MTKRGRERSEGAGQDVPAMEFPASNRTFSNKSLEDSNVPILRPGHSIAGLAAYHVEVDICDPRKRGSPKKTKVPEERVETQMKESTKKARNPKR